MTTPPNPGSDEARAQGCVCPGVVTRVARGIGWTSVVTRTDCPLHGEAYARGTNAGDVAGGER